MGRTIQSATQTWIEEEKALQRFTRALRREDQAVMKEPPFTEHRVAATDIDMARHMNNVAYVRAIIDGFSSKEWAALHVKQMDVIFINSAREGDVLRFQRRRDGDALDIRGTLPDGRTSVLVRITCS